jgi:hypothetical protein
MQAYDIGGWQIRYDAIWESGGDREQTRALAWALDDFAQRFDDEVSASRRCVHMQAYAIGAGQIRYDGVWERGNGQQQTRALAWALDDFTNRFTAELGKGRRCVHMQAYDVGGGLIRYDGIWETGDDQGQSAAFAWAFNDFVQRCEQEAAAGKRLVHLQAYDIGSGQLRYDGVWQKSDDGDQQRRALALPLDTFADHFDELTSSGMHVELMSACLRTYDLLQPSHFTKGTVAGREVFFGSDFDRKPAFMAPLPIEPMTTRRPGCDLKPKGSVR